MGISFFMWFVVLSANPAFLIDFVFLIVSLNPLWVYYLSTDLIGLIELSLRSVPIRMSHSFSIRASGDFFEGARRGQVPP